MGGVQAGHDRDRLAEIAQRVGLTPDQMIAAATSQDARLALDRYRNGAAQDDGSGFAIMGDWLVPGAGARLITLDEQLQLLVAPLRGQDAQISFAPRNDR